MKKAITEKTLAFVNAMGASGFWFECMDEPEGIIFKCIAEDRCDGWWGMVTSFLKAFGYNFCSVMCEPDEDGSIVCSVIEEVTEDKYIDQWKDSFCK